MDSIPKTFVITGPYYIHIMMKCSSGFCNVNPTKCTIDEKNEVLINKIKVEVKI